MFLNITPNGSKNQSFEGKLTKTEVNNICIRMPTNLSEGLKRIIHVPNLKKTFFSNLTELINNYDL